LLEEDISNQELPVLESEQKESYLDVVYGDQLDASKLSEIKDLVYEFRHIFSDIPGRTNIIDVDIVLEQDRVVNVKPYPIPLNLRDELDKQLDSMLKMDIIEPSSAKYSSPVVMVKKPDNTYRLCSDYRQINKLVKADLEPIPKMEVIWSKVEGSCYYSKFDLTRGFWQLELSESCRDITSFATHRGLFRYKYLPFGLTSSPAIFTRMMRKLLEGSDHLEHFFDDVLAHSVTWSDHLSVLRDMFDRVSKANLTLKPAKCILGCQQVDFLGNTMTNKGILPIQKKVENIHKVVRPVTKVQLQSFLGMVNFYRRFIQNFSSISACLTDLIKKGKPNKLDWELKHENAFNLLKDELLKEPILIWPNMEDDFLVQTDASMTGIGAVLLQKRDGVNHPVMYASRKLLPRETRYSTIERELLGIVWGIQKFQIYLYGKRFFLETDHQALTFLKTAHPDNHRLLRWGLILENYDFTIKYVKGSDNVVADYLSRSE
jgi:hypothetical protein